MAFAGSGGKRSARHNHFVFLEEPMRKSTAASAAMILVLIPATLYLGTRLTGRWYYLTSTLIVLETMLPFFISFERRRPQARELAILAVMTALAAASRVAFAFLPGFKPITGVIMLTGISFGAQAGFLSGAVAAFASNFFFGQGPWTPWQMMAYGFGGFLAGCIFHNRPGWQKRGVLTAFGFFTIVLIVGPLLDAATIFITGSRITGKFILAVFASGLPVNVTHAAACAVTMALLGKPLLKKLNRLKTKYGILAGQG